MKTLKLLVAAGLLLMPTMKAQTAAPVNPCVPNVTITPIPNTYGCYSIVATNTAAPNEPDSYYQWNFGNVTATGKTVYHCYSPSIGVMNHTLSLTYTSPALCGVQPNVYTFTISVPPPPMGTCVNNVPTFSLSANSVTVYAGSVIPEIITNYQYGDGSGVSPYPYHTYGSCGNYILEVREWDMNAVPTVTCYAYAAINIPCNSSLAIGEQHINALKRYYPNPVQEVLTIETSQRIEKVIAGDLMGKGYPLRFNGDGDIVTIETANLPAGAYVLSIYFSDGRHQSVKLLKD